MNNNHPLHNYYNIYQFTIFFPFQADIEIPIPRYFTAENAKVLKEREKMRDTILAKITPDEEDVSCYPTFRLIVYYVPSYICK